MFIKKTVCTLSALLALVINPLLFAPGCLYNRERCGGDVEVEYNHEELLAELRDEVPRSYSFKLGDGSTAEVSFVVDEQSIEVTGPYYARDQSTALIASAYADCGEPVLGRANFKADVTIAITSPEAQGDVFTIENYGILGVYTVSGFFSEAESRSLKLNSLTREEVNAAGLEALDMRVDSDRDTEQFVVTYFELEHEDERIWADVP